MTTRRTPPKITESTKIGRVIDLEKETPVAKSGWKVTPDAVERLVVASRGRGRPSLTGQPKHSPIVTVRVTPEIRARAEQVAAEEGTTVSQLAREALVDRIERPRRAPRSKKTPASKRSVKA